MMKQQGMMIGLLLMTTLTPRETETVANYSKAKVTTKVENKINK